jgi:hypothetical protein
MGYLDRLRPVAGCRLAGGAAQAVIRQASQIIRDTPGVAHVNAYAGFSVLGGGDQSNAGTLFTRLTDPELRAGQPEFDPNSSSIPCNSVSPSSMTPSSPSSRRRPCGA